MADLKVPLKCPSCGASAVLTLACGGVTPATPPVTAPAAPPADRLLKTGAVCRRLGCSKRKVYEMLGLRGFPAVLPYLKVGIDYHVSEQAIEAYIASNTVVAGNDRR